MNLNSILQLGLQAFLLMTLKGWLILTWR